MDSRIDGRGRIVLPKRLRERFGLVPGRRVDVQAGDDGIVLRPHADREEVLQRLRGAIHGANRDPRAKPLDPRDVKRIWEPRV